MNLPLASALGADKVIAGTVVHSVGRRGAGDIVLERLRGIGMCLHESPFGRIDNGFLIRRILTPGRIPTRLP